MKKKNIIIVTCAILAIGVIALVLAMNGNKGNVDKLINEACRVVENKFAEEFEGCTLTELRYDVDVENRFAEEIERYHKEKNQELIVLLSTFDTDGKGGDGSLNPNDTYTNWQWHLVRTADKNSWEIITWGY